VLLTEIIHNMIGHDNGVSIFCGIGERCRFTAQHFVACVAPERGE
jgi:F0F1-type ATP synthase beta subunit